ncbi:uncharacterized protein LOC115547599 [Gadus morhua]|uniref:uncharacterized protein LOC115547599 n=1 Tax=Gadus morhua TaxID=8049 RepID=UPI0011B4899C|nr:uncharacterized protein LOC115547599 [Gadus morhua]
MQEKCQPMLTGALVVMAIALLCSVCVNIVQYYLRQRKNSKTDSIERRYQRQSSSSSMENGVYRFHDDIPEHQENPIYGNILKVRRVKGCTAPRESMTLQHAQGNKPSESHMNYASLDLKETKRGHKKKNGVHPGPTGDPRPDLQATLLRPPGEAEEGRLSSGGGGSPGPSHSSIYLNSHQIAMETEERGRDDGWPGTSRPPTWGADGDWPLRNGAWGPAGERESGEEEEGEGGEEGEEEEEEEGAEGWLEARC